ncbi:MAG TPA: hypothetical protein DEZ08_06305 [Dehalococcoidia bacterium]|jgi:hypothetical protein|nr:hypothetical protein [Dehalococcoidia bacterium]
MPMRVGFTEFRKQMLEEELKLIEELLPTIGVKKVILTGAMTTGIYAPDSPINLVVIQETDSNYVRREDFFYYHLNTNVSVETAVYTPEEFEVLQHELPVLIKACKEGRILYDDEQ